MDQLCFPDVRAKHGSVTALLALVTLAQLRKPILASKEILITWCRKKNDIGLVLVIPVFPYLGILIAFTCPSPWLQNKSSPFLCYCSHPAVVCVPFSCNAGSSLLLQSNSPGH